MFPLCESAPMRPTLVFLESTASQYTFLRWNKFSVFNILMRCIMGEIDTINCTLTHLRNRTARQIKSMRTKCVSSSSFINSVFFAAFKHPIYEKNSPENNEDIALQSSCETDASRTIPHRVKNSRNNSDSGLWVWSYIAPSSICVRVLKSVNPPDICIFRLGRFNSFKC